MDLLTLEIERVGFFTRAQALDCGYDDRAIADHLRAGVWHRVRRGRYTTSETWRGLDESGRHRLLCRVVLSSLGPRVALSHTTGALTHGLDTWGVPTDRIHVTRLDGGSGRIEAGVVHHQGVSLDDEVVDVDGLPVLLPARCALETGALGTAESALVSLDSLLHRSLATPEEMFRQFRLMQHWPWMQHLHIPVRMADGGAHSVGESRGRWLFRLSGVPAPICQYEIIDADGKIIATCDWGWPELGALGEFDGRMKYGRDLSGTDDAGSVVFAEKQREDAIRDLTGMRMFRMIWTDLDRPRVTRERLLRALGHRAG